MSDEVKLTQAAVRGTQAEALLRQEILTDAFKALEDAYTLAWRSTLIEDVSGREKLFLAINIVGKVRDHISAVVTNGKLAQAELAELANTAERKRRFGII